MNLLLSARVRVMAAFVLLLTLPVASALAQTPTWQSVSKLGVGGSPSITLDAAGNAYITGSFSGRANFGTIQLNSVGLADVFVAKRTRAGAYQWAIRVGGFNDDNSRGIAVDSAGHVYVSGIYSSSAIVFGATTLTNAGGGAPGFVAKLTPAGAWEWATRTDGSGYASCSAVAPDNSGHVVVSGSFGGGIVAFDTTQLVPAGNDDLFVAKLSPTGAWLWAKRAGGTDGDYCLSVGVDSSRNVYITGYLYSSPVAFGATTLYGVTSHVYVAKLSPTGSWLWATGATDGDLISSGGAAVDRSGNVFLTGTFYSTAHFGSITLLSSVSGISDIFVGKMTPAGNWQWVKRAGGIGFDHGYGVALDSAGSVYVTGEFVGNMAYFGNTTLNSTGSDDVFVAKLSAFGGWQWAVKAGGTRDDAGFEVAADSRGTVYVGGLIRSDNATFGTLPFPTNLAATNGIFFGQLAVITGLPEASAAPAFTLTPNPATTTVQLTGGGFAGSPPTATLLDARGRLVRTWLLAQPATDLDLTGLPAGLYLLRAGATARRLVVE